MRYKIEIWGEQDSLNQENQKSKMGIVYMKRVLYRQIQTSELGCVVEVRVTKMRGISFRTEPQRDDPSAIGALRHSWRHRSSWGQKGEVMDTVIYQFSIVRTIGHTVHRVCWYISLIIHVASSRSGSLTKSKVSVQWRQRKNSWRILEQHFWQVIRGMNSTVYGSGSRRGWDVGLIQMNGNLPFPFPLLLPLPLSVVSLLLLSACAWSRMFVAVWVFVNLDREEGIGCEEHRISDSCECNCTTV